MQYKDWRDFADRYPDGQEKDEVLKTLSDEEIWHLAITCTNHTGRAWIASHMKDQSYRGPQE